MPFGRKRKNRKKAAAHKHQSRVHRKVRSGQYATSGGGGGQAQTSSSGGDSSSTGETGEIKKDGYYVDHPVYGRLRY